VSVPSRTQAAAPRIFARQLDDPTSATYEVGDIRLRADGVYEMLTHITVSTPQPNPYYPLFGDVDPSRLLYQETWMPAATVHAKWRYLVPNDGSEPSRLYDALIAEGWTPPEVVQ
jgi:hypothetical protein